MKKYICLLAAAMIGVLSACASGTAPAPAAEPAGEVSADVSGDISIVTTIFPEYDWVRQVLGENPANAELTLLLDSGVDLHSYQPTAQDILKISTCDLFLYVGGESDTWVDDALQEASNPDMVVINLLEVLGDRVREEELVEGMQDEEHEHHEEHEEHEEHDHHDGDGPEYDEHVWLSLRNASVLVSEIEKALAAIDPDNKALYAENAAAYTASLEELDARYTEMAENAGLDTVLFGSRFPFRYLTDDYGLSYYAAFVGCSAETEASFETIVFLAGKADELGLPAILTIDGDDGRIASTIRESSSTGDQQILVMDSLQSTTSEDVAAGATYLSAMEANLEVLRQALSK